MRLGERRRSPLSTGRDNPTHETPVCLIEPSASFGHDAGMEQIATLAVETIVDPVVLVPSIVVGTALASGLVARVIEFCEDRLSRRRFD